MGNEMYNGNQAAWLLIADYQSSMGAYITDLLDLSLSLYQNRPAVRIMFNIGIYNGELSIFTYTIICKDSYGSKYDVQIKYKRTSNGCKIWARCQKVVLSSTFGVMKHPIIKQEPDIDAMEIELQQV